jgi:Zn-dependent protease with chaperone function
MPRKTTMLLCFLLGISLSWAQTRVEPGFNLFSEEQDVEIGRQSAEEVEKQLPILRLPAVDGFIAVIGQRLQAAIQGPDFPYRFRVANISDVNAFALPGGFMYINRGLIETAENEAELAGVMAHEMAHVALRHGTNQASKAYLAQAGLGVLGGLIGGGQGGTGQMIEAVGGFGLNTVFLKFSRSAEEQADIVGAQTLARAGYDPRGMVSFFEKMQELSGRDPGKFEGFFSTHPAPSNRARRVEEEIAMMGPVRLAGSAGNWRRVRQQLAGLPDAQSMQQLAAAADKGKTTPGGKVEPLPRQSEITVDSIASPSTQLQIYESRNRSFRVRYPSNWRPMSTDRNLGVTIVPDGGVVDLSSGERALVYGLIVSQFDPFEGENRRYSQRSPFTGRSHLATSSNRFVQRLLATNQYLRLVRKNENEILDGEQALSARLEGVSPLTGQRERVDLFTRVLPTDHIACLVFIRPSSRAAEFEELMRRVLSSVSINDPSVRD